MSNHSYKNLYIVDKQTLHAIQLQFVPDSLNFQSKTKVVTIASVGRNNPFYHYTGSEDVLSFQIKWLGNEASREDVIKKCRFLQSLAKNDGYSSGLKTVLLIWDQSLFTQYEWIVVQANYSLSQFHKLSGSLPTVAVQDIVLKRVVNGNLTHEDIREFDESNATTGLFI